MNYNNKDLYQILKIEKSASHEQIVKKSQELVKKDSPEEIGIASMVLTDPQKRIEYDTNGWKDDWWKEFERDNAFRHSIFQAIMAHIKSLNDQEFTTPDGFRVYVIIDDDLDPNLWAPCRARFSAWIDKMFEIFRSRGWNQHWKEQLKDFKNKIIEGLNQAHEKNKKTPLLGECWEGVEEGNCAKCGKAARLRRKGEFSDGKSYCSSDCYYDRKWENEVKEVEKFVPKKYIDKEKWSWEETFICDKCSKVSERVPFPGGDGKKYCSWDCLNEAVFKPLYKDYEEKKEKIPPQIPHKDKEEYKCKNCGKKFTGDDYVIIDLDRNREYFCSKECREKRKTKINVKNKISELEKFLAKKRSENNSEERVEYEYNRLTGKTTRKKVKWNPLAELLKWMKREGIINISLNSNGNLVIEYRSNQNKIVADNDLSEQQKEIKEFLQLIKQQGGEPNFNQRELEESIGKNNEAGSENKKNGNSWIMPVVIIGLGIIIFILIGFVIYYKNKKKKDY
ncbi:MAG: hypothetical protein I3273_03545 [Candidatus Moeniiplasma glomeromycotorum]|nr:hypothetical protein [Candidatus Moeniiplasma glomeromycotorum]MCE8169176.1 hypothetical protein [Candidatus Moeniiplasma glomeromycotorum]